MNQETTPQTKICTKCKDEKYIYEFCKSKIMKDGIYPQCKECVKQYQQQNKEKISNYIKVYQSNNKEKIALKQKKYNNTSKGRIAAKNIQYKRRSLIDDGDATTNQILELEQNAKVCYWCHKPLKNIKPHIDHYNPLSKGGEHTLNNLVVSCPACNLKKSAKDPIVFAQSIGRLF